MGLNAIARRLRLLVDRAVVRMVSDSLERQNLQIQTLADATDDDVDASRTTGLLPFRRKVLKPSCWPWADGVTGWLPSRWRTSDVARKACPPVMSGCITRTVNRISR